MRFHQPLSPGGPDRAASAGIRVAIVLVGLLLTRLKVFRGHAVMTDPWLQGIGLAVFVPGLALAVPATRGMARSCAAS